MLRLTRRAVRQLLRRPGLVAVAIGLLGAGTLLGLAPALAPVSGLIWGSLAFLTLALAGLYAVARVQPSIREMSKDIDKLRRSRAVQRRRLVNSKKRMRRLERALVRSAQQNADLSRSLARLEASIEKRRVAAPDLATDDVQRLEGKPKRRVAANGESAAEDAPVRLKR